MIQTNELILFQGDSITDCRRDRENAGTVNDLHGLGAGYAMMVAAELLSGRPGGGLQFLNRGISGNRSVDLYARIKSDFINLHPTLASILIGVNDTWLEQRGGNGVSVPKYERICRALLGEVVEVNQRRAVVAQLAGEFRATLVPFQSLFDEAVEKAPPDYWALDGVHPTAAGHMLMAKCWLRHVCGDPR